MVSYVTKRRPVSPETSVIGHIFSQAATSFPWQTVIAPSLMGTLAGAATKRTAPLPTPPPAILPPAILPPAILPPAILPLPTPAPQVYHSGEGCTAADNAIMVHGHLTGLARGYGGFGLLRVSKERLDEAARAAEKLGQKTLAHDMKAIASELPNVRDEAAALGLANRLDPVIRQAWDLGKRCKGALTPEEIERAKSLARDVKSGKLTLEQAKEQLLHRIKGGGHAF